MNVTEKSRTIIFPGSFDPFTCGHADIIQRALPLFDNIIIAVGYNEHKSGWIPVEERVRAIAELYSGEPRISVESYCCLTADFAADRNVRFLLRGVRDVTDYEYELHMADVNRRLSGLETILLPASAVLSGVSSSVVRELAHFGKDITEFLPDGIHYNNI